MSWLVNIDFIINQLLKQSIYHAINLSIYQSINKCINQSIYQSIYQWMYQSINLSFNLSFNQSNNISISVSVYQSINQCINQSIKLSINLLIISLTSITFISLFSLPWPSLSAYYHGNVDLCTYLYMSSSDSLSPVMFLIVTRVVFIDMCYVSFKACLKNAQLVVLVIVLWKIVVKVRLSTKGRRFKQIFELLLVFVVGRLAHAFTLFTKKSATVRQ